MLTLYQTIPAALRLTVSWKLFHCQESLTCASILSRFGPVNIFWSSRYDTAMTLFLACLKDFAEFANSMDKESGIPLEDCFKLPYKIENDKVENYSIIMSFNKPENWTKALKYLKYTLCNLKWVLFWFVGNTGFQPHRDPSVNFLSTPKLVRLKIESEFPQTPEILAFNIF
ncbi:beclin-1-like protein [Amborella trichopoda]|uniref:beclin-1-like protein n=1 Tax=Amborella trichopoda TaxID=13333 RepID=UPI0009C04D4E|nr:beclin-1-like protein [Amborella trichopoda]|eukprot:XP_020524876.1 beclin-1-like protein [Amborella trichopoda]